MSIHKSKGLEFPVVFLCGTGKQFNMQDLKDDILLHQDIGFGPVYTNYERKIEYNTLAKEAIKVKLKNEVLSEEMRLLYVGLSRSKEKLIITGVKKSKRDDSKDKEGVIPVSILKNAKSYLDWLELIYLYNKIEVEKDLSVLYHKKEEALGSGEVKEKKEVINVKELIDKKLVNEDDKEYKMIDKLLSWEYPNILLTKIEGKSSVSKISKEERKEEYIDISKKPKFLSESIKLTRAEIGTAMHLVLQKLNFSIEYSETKVKELIEELVLRNILTNNEKEELDVNQIMKFTKSSLYTKIKSAKKVFKEQHFYINIPAREIYNEDIEENILVQGIIDLYFIDKDDNIILIDYKTDYVKNDKSELIEKYRKQLEIYKRAIENVMQKRIKETYIYSTYLGEEVLIK